MTVTKQQQLEWMSNAHKDWPFILDYICMSNELIGIVAYVVGSHRITKQEWQQERDKMQKQDNKSECAVMTLSEAIDHANEKSRELEGNCAANHGLLAHWLTEYRDILSNLNQQNEQNNSWHERGELPPVGAYCCGYVTEDDRWIDIEVIAHRDGHALGWSSDEKRGFRSDNAECFRPFRTEREKAIDEMVSVVLDKYHNSEIINEACSMLYDAGYRKAKP